MSSFLLKTSVSALALAFVPVTFAQPAAADSSTAAPAPGVTTLNQIVEQTLLSNPEIQAKYHDFQASLEGQAVARGAFFPQVNALGYVGREYRNNVPGVGSQNWNR
ncbi:membrane protein, partial [Achromobacter xylosoxidans]